MIPSVLPDPSRLMARIRGGVHPGALAVALTLGLSSTPAKARRRTIVHKLLHSKSYKVRLQAAIYLGKMRDPKLIWPLVRCLRKDPHYLVRALCASALGKLGDARALPALKDRQRDKKAFVRARVKKAIEQIKAQSLAAEAQRKGGGYQIMYKRRAKAFVIVKPIKRRRRYLPRRVATFLQKTLRLQLNELPRIEVAQNGVSVPRAWLTKRRLRAFTLHTTLVAVSRRRRGRDLSVTTNIRTVVTTYPGGAVRFMTTTEARSTQSLKSRRISRQDLEALYRYLERQAAEGAVQRVARRIAPLSY